MSITPTKITLRKVANHPLDVLYLHKQIEGVAPAIPAERCVNTEPKQPLKHLKLQDDETGKSCARRPGGVVEHWHRRSGQAIQ